MLLCIAAEQVSHTCATGSGTLSSDLKENKVHWYCYCGDFNQLVLLLLDMLNEDVKIASKKSFFDI